jgi:hypothetical protein
MRQRVASIVLIFLLLLGLIAPFSALSALMLIAVGSLLCSLLVLLVRTLVVAEVEDEDLGGEKV